MADLDNARVHDLEIGIIGSGSMGSVSNIPTLHILQDHLQRALLWSQADQDTRV